MRGLPLAQQHKLRPRRQQAAHGQFIFRGIQGAGDVGQLAALLKQGAEPEQHPVLQGRKLFEVRRSPPGVLANIRPPCQHAQAAARGVQKDMPVPAPQRRRTGIRQTDSRARQMKLPAHAGQMTQAGPGAVCTQGYVNALLQQSNTLAAEAGAGVPDRSIPTVKLQSLYRQLRTR